jgi:hypothetical protein
MLSLISHFLHQYNVIKLNGVRNNQTEKAGEEINDSSPAKIPGYARRTVMSVNPKAPEGP